MNRNSESEQSGSLSENSGRYRSSKKRVRKRLRKDHYGSKNEYLDSQEDRSRSSSRNDIEETKSPRRVQRGSFQRRTSRFQGAESDNGFQSDEESSHRSGRRKSRRAERSEFEDDLPSDSSPRRKHSKIKVKVKKIDDEGVGNFFRFSRIDSWNLPIFNRFTTT